LQSIQEAIDLDIIDCEPDGNNVNLLHLFPFGISENGEILCWDLSSGSIDNEYLIYILGPRMQSIRYGARNLYEFIERIGAHHCGCRFIRCKRHL